MVKNSRAKMVRMVVRKEPELIDLDSSDDEKAGETSVMIVDLDETDSASKVKNKEITISPSLNGIVDTPVETSVIIVDLEESDNAGKVKNKEVTISPSLDVIVEAPKKAVSPAKSLSTDVTPVIATLENSCDIDEKFSAIDESIRSHFSIVDSVTNSDLLSKSQHTNIDRNEFSEFCHDLKLKSTSLCDSDVMFVKLVKQNSPSTSPLSDSDTGSVLKDSNKQVRKRKLILEKKSATDVEHVEILDDDIIVLDDSFTTNSSTKTQTLSQSEVLVVEPSGKHNTKLKSSKRKYLSIPSCTSSSSNTFSTLPHPDASNFTNLNQIKSSKSECESSNVDTTQNSGPPKKKSKLTYHRPAHLITPLTQPTPAIPSTKVDAVTNIYNPNADSSEKRTGLRPIVIDGNNVAIGHGKGTFSLKGLHICINFFEKRGHRQIKVFIPHYRKNRDNHDELQKMERKGILVTTPSRKVNGKIVSSYDDRYIVQYAAEFGGIIVSTDNFRDLLNENPSWRETIETRLLMFTWVDDLLMFPQDPLGRNGPSLDDFLKFPDT